MAYIVISPFTDLQDDNYPYNVGDTFPHSGMSVTEARFAELAGGDNKQRRPLIKRVEEEKKDSIPTKTDVARMNLATLQEVATKEGIDITDKTGNELKKELIEHWDL